jgi:hypothetical protein
MAVDVEIRGAAELRAAARDLRQAERELRQRMDRSLRTIGKRFERDIRGAARRLPSGYAPVMAADVRVSTSLRNGGLSLRVWAPGKGDQRDVRAIDAGTLRHPVFGHRTRWSAQRVRPGFVEAPRRRLAEHVQDDIEAAVDQAVAIATRG